MNTIVKSVIALVLLHLSLPTLAANQAGKVVYAFGDVAAVTADGSRRALARGDAFGPGDTVTTRKGRAQLRFTDGGFAALQPNTAYEIEDYNFKGRADGSERSFMNLVRGSVRLVTGLIGRSNKQNFRLRTAVATIGIRGTSGKISHCDANCGERGPGTALAGYGGIWDLASGSYNGPVTPGQATFCNGASCFDIPGFGQRSQVQGGGDDDSELEKMLGESDEATGDGQNEQFSSDGNQFAANNDSGLIIGSNLAGARAGGKAFGTAFGDSGAGSAIVVFKGGLPVAELAIDAGSAQGGFEFIVTDVNAFLSAFGALGDAELSAQLQSLFDTVSPADLASLAADPVNIADADFGRTSDGFLTKGRWTDGYLLALTDDLASQGELSGGLFKLVELRGNRSEHFLYGADAGVMPTTGTATYNFTGGTLSTAVDGSSIGSGVTGGSLTFDFLAATGTLNMTVVHSAMTFAVLGDLFLETDHRFFDSSSVTATAGGNAYNVDIEGFFAQPGTAAPLAAGLGYTIETPVAIVGVAGFGLGTTGASTPLNTGLPQGGWVGFAHTYLSGAVLNSEAFDFLTDGVGSTATLTNGVVTAFSSNLHDVCTGGSPCTFNSNGVTPILDPTAAGGATSLPDLGMRWARFQPGYTATHLALGGSPTLNGSAHLLSVDVPTPVGVIPTTGSSLGADYNLPIGGTQTMVSFQTNGVQQPEVASTITSAGLFVNFDTGQVSATFSGTFPAGGGTGNWSLTGNGPFGSGDGIHSISSLTGFVSSAAISSAGGTPDCGSPCSLFGHTHFVIGSVSGDVAAGTLQGNTSGGPGFNMAWAYVLRAPGGFINVAL